MMIALLYPILTAILFITLPSCKGAYTQEGINSALEELKKNPVLANSQYNQLTVKDLFSLADKEVPEMYVSNDGTSYIDRKDSYYQENHQHFENLQQAAETVVTAYGSLQATRTPPDHIGLDSTCSDKLCNMMEYLVSCKAFDFGIRKICARYLFGSFYGCSQFPNYVDSIYDAPSICLEEYLTLLAEIVTGVAGLSDDFQKDVTNYLFKNFTTNACGRRCYRSYQLYSNDFYLNCATQVAQYNKSYPIPAVLSIFQPFRNQACAQNVRNDSCYVQVSTTFAGIQVLNQTVYHGNLDLPDITGDYTCNYYGLNYTYENATLAEKNLNVLQSSCKILRNAGCCAGTGISIVQLNQIESLKKQTVLFPPCFLNYMRLSCTPVHLNEMCTKGSTANQGTLQGYFSVPNVSQATYPNVYSEQSLLSQQKILTTILQSAGFGHQPYNFNAGYPFQIYLIGYAYFGVDGQLTPTDGSTAYPPTSDWKQSINGTFYYQIVMQNVNSSQVLNVQKFLSSAAFQSLLRKAYDVPGTAPITAVAYSGEVYVAEPDTLASAASPALMMNSFLVLCSILVVSYHLLFSSTV